MPISKTTRDRRVSRWNEMKRAWEAKLDAADNDNGRAVATAMITQAEAAIKRLEITDEVVPEVLEPITVPSKGGLKKTKKAKDTTGTLGL